MPNTQQNLTMSVSTPLGADKLIITRMHGEERLSGLFQFTLEMYSEDKALSFDDIVGKHATVTLKLQDGSSRYIDGLVTRMIQAGSDGAHHLYIAEIRPWLWLLTLTRSSKIYQNKTALQIIQDIFDTLGFTDYSDKTSATYTEREYCVQYQESDFQFVSRLMEDEGVFYFFEHASGKHTLVLADDADAHATCPGLTQARYGSVLIGETPSDDLLTELSVERQVVLNEYKMDDFNFETPSNELLSKVTGQSGKLAFYDYPGGYTKKDAGDAIASKRLQMCEVPGKSISGQGHCRPFAAGHKFTLVDHYRPDVNADYVLSHVSFNCTQDGYQGSFKAFPSSVPFRPARMTPRPRIHGTQTAIVSGKSGEEIWTDKYGRVKVQFHWDQEGKSDENSSCWVRVAQGWAGKSWGSIFIPRVGQEVVVSFLDGDPDRPLVTGCVYNATQTVPYTLPDNQTRSTIKTNVSKGGGGSNEIRFEDKKDSEEIYIHAQKDMNVLVDNDWTSTIKQNRASTVQEGNETLTVQKGNRTVKVEKGDETHEVKGKRELTVTGNETHTNKADFTQTVTGAYKLTVDGDLTIDVKGSITIKAGQDITNKAGMNMTNQAGMNLDNKADMNLTNKASMSLTNEGGVSLNAKGAMHTVEASGIMTVKGAMVKIN